MAALRIGSRESVLGETGSFRFNLTNGVLREADLYTPPIELLKRSLGHMVTGHFSEMMLYLRANRVSLSSIDVVALELMEDETKRKMVAEKMMKAISYWGGYLPVIDRNGAETVMAVIGESLDGCLDYYILANAVGRDGLDWFKLKDMWPMVFYEYWSRNNQCVVKHLKDSQREI